LKSSETYTHNTTEIVYIIALEDVSKLWTYEPSPWALLLLPQNLLWEFCLTYDLFTSKLKISLQHSSVWQSSCRSRTQGTKFTVGKSCRSKHLLHAFLDSAPWQCSRVWSCDL